MIRLDGVTIVASSGTTILDSVSLRVGVGDVHALLSSDGTRTSDAFDAMLGGSITRTSTGTRTTRLRNAPGT